MKRRGVPEKTIKGDRDSGRFNKVMENHLYVTFSSIGRQKAPISFRTPQLLDSGSNPNDAPPPKLLKVSHKANFNTNLSHPPSLFLRFQRIHPIGFTNLK